MTADDCIKWIQGRITVFMPTEDMGNGDISVRLPQIMGAAVSVASGNAFGFTFPEAIRVESIRRTTPLIEQAVENWRTWLVERFGDEGREFFDRAALNHGFKKPSPKVLGKDVAVSQALARLRARLADTGAATTEWRKRDWLEEDEAHGYAIAPPLVNAGELLASFELQSEPLPKELEALYADMNGLWTGSADPPGGEQPFDEGEEYFVFMTLESLLDHHDDRDDDLIILNQHPDYFSWTMLSRKDGAIYHATKLDGGEAPKKIASSLAEYLEQLARSCGKRY